MTQIALGSKRKCLTCDTLFFDLQRDPIICPKCREVFIPQALPHSPPPYKSRTQIPEPPDATVQADGKSETPGQSKAEASEADTEAEEDDKNDKGEVLEAEEADDSGGLEEGPSDQKFDADADEQP